MSGAAVDVKKTSYCRTRMTGFAMPSGNKSNCKNTKKIFNPLQKSKILITFAPQTKGY